MKNLFLLVVVLFSLGFATCRAGEMQRIGHTTLLPLNSNPPDGGLYNAFIDPTGGYAYFLGNYLWKLDIHGDSPVQVGAPINAGSSSYAAIDPAAGYAYISRITNLYRFSCGANTNPVTAAGSLLFTPGTIGPVAIDDSDLDPSKHIAYVFWRVPGAPTRVEKVSLGSFTLGSYINLNANETNLGSSLTDTTHGYIYFSTIAGGSTNTEIVKIKMTPGTNLPVRIGAVSAGATGEGIGLGSLDAVNGYCYYGTYGSATLPSRVYKIKLGDGDTAPTLVGHIDLQQGRAQLSLSVVDPANGFLYFANDNTYPGGVHQFKLNGSNLPTEIAYLPCLSGPNNNPPDATSTYNVTTNIDGILPYGEVYFRSSIFDPVRGYAYFGQDSKPNQFVKIKLAKPDPFSAVGTKTQNGTFQIAFTNIIGGSFGVLSATDSSTPLTNWTRLGNATDNPPGNYLFTDLQSSNKPRSFYRVTSP